MKIYEIKESDEHIGVLQYYEKEKCAIIELSDKLDEWNCPLLFSAYIKQKIYTIPREVSFMWIKERVIPSGRQNIGAILNTHHMKEYDEMKLLELSRGICSQDDMYIAPLNELPNYVVSRQKKNLVECIMLRKNSALCIFNDGTIKKIQLDKLSEISYPGTEWKNDITNILENERLYASGKIGTGGYSLTFNDSIDFPADILYEHGEIIPLDIDDIKTIVVNNIVDTSTSCELLGCTRQNLSYLVSQGELQPVKENVKGNLYLKGNVIEKMW